MKFLDRVLIAGEKSRQWKSKYPDNCMKYMCFGFHDVLDRVLIGWWIFILQAFRRKDK